MCRFIYKKMISGPLSRARRARERYNQYKKDGICTHCHENLAPDSVYCPECAVKNRKRMKEYNRKKKWKINKKAI